MYIGDDFKSCLFKTRARLAERENFLSERHYVYLLDGRYVGIYISLKHFGHACVSVT